MTLDEPEEQDGGKTEGQGDAVTHQDPVSHGILFDGSLICCLFFPRSTYAWEFVVKFVMLLCFVSYAHCLKTVELISRSSYFVLFLVSSQFLQNYAVFDLWTLSVFAEVSVIAKYSLKLASVN